MAEILLVSEDKERAESARSLLRQDGHHVSWIREVHRWREIERETGPDLVVASVASADPVLSAPARPTRGFPAPLLFLQLGAETFREMHVDERIIDRMESPFMAEDFLGRVDALVRVRRIVRHEDSAAGAAGASSSRARNEGRGVRGMFRRVRDVLGVRVPPYAKATAPYLEVAARVADWADRRDAFEPGHAERVTSFAAMIADGFNLPDNEAAALLRAAMLHDIGKVCLPVEVLRQRGPLEEKQMRLLRKHAERGASLLRALDPDDAVVEAIHYHHERVDGQGYHGKKAADIPRAARILAVAEAYDAMTTSLVREKMTSDRALGLLRDKRGEHFDPDCVDALVDAVRPRPRAVPLSRA